MFNEKEFNNLPIDKQIDFLINRMHRSEVQEYNMHVYKYDRKNYGFIPFYTRDLDMTDVVIFTTPNNKEINYCTNHTKNKNVDKLAVETGIVPWNNMGRPKDMKVTTDLITVHDTGDAVHSAKWWNDLEKTNDNREVSWNFTVGEDKIFQQIPILEVAWHAGDGHRPFSLRDTGVKFTKENPDITMNKDGYLYINGEKSLIEIPLIENSRNKDMNGKMATEICKAGLYTSMGENGNYQMADIYASNYDQELNKYYICTKGGNRNSIGIETDIHEGVDYNEVMRNTANLVSNMLVYFELDPSRILQHRNFSGKHCPQLMIENELWENFKNICENEYIIKKYFNDIKITYNTSDNELLSNTGKVLKEVKEPTKVNYQVKVTYKNIEKAYSFDTIIKPIK